MCDTKKTFFITGGGTGGHIYPAIAVANELVKNGHSVFFIGNKKNLEYKICTENNLKFLSVSVGYMPRKLSLKFFLWAIQTFIASLIAIFYVLKYKPNASFATGGYVSAPILIASLLLKVPYMNHDCDSYPGIVSRVFSKYSSATSLAFESAKKYLRAKDVFVFGNPVREKFFNIQRDENNFSTLLIMGGSQGAKSLNEAGLGVIEYYKNNENVRIILQTGTKNYDDVIKNIGEIPKNTIIEPYFKDLSEPLSKADLVISRAGSLSISEICATGLPSILVPYPYAAANHQTLNAKAIEEIGGGILLEDSKCSKENLIEILDGLLFDKNKLNEIALKTKAHSKEGALQNIVSKLIEISK